MADLSNTIIDGDPYNVVERGSTGIPFTGATASTNGAQGDVPAPLAGDQNKFLTGGGQWEANTANLITNYTTQDDSTTTDIITPSGGETAISTLESGANHARLFNKISRCFLNMRKLINTVKRIWNVIGQTWTTGETVQVNWHRLYNDKWYRCIRAHTTSSSILPTNTTYWVEVTVDSEITNAQNAISSLNSNLTKHDLSSGTVITTTEYTIPSDGYVIAHCSYVKGQYVYVSLNGIRMIQLTTTGSSSSYGMQGYQASSVFVRKGMKARIESSSGDVGVEFYALR